MSYQQSILPKITLRTLFRSLFAILIPKKKKITQYQTSEMKREIACGSRSGRNNLISMSRSTGRARLRRRGIAEISPNNEGIKAA
jgi:hypothetical protein